MALKINNILGAAVDAARVAAERTARRTTSAASPEEEQPLIPTSSRAEREANARAGGGARTAFGLRRALQNARGFSRRGGGGSDARFVSSQTQGAPSVADISELAGSLRSNGGSEPGASGQQPTATVTGRAALAQLCNQMANRSDRSREAASDASSDRGSVPGTPNPAGGSHAEALHERPAADGSQSDGRASEAGGSEAASDRYRKMSQEQLTEELRGRLNELAGLCDLDPNAHSALAALRTPNADGAADDEKTLLDALGYLTDIGLKKLQYQIDNAINPEQRQEFEEKYQQLEQGLREMRKELELPDKSGDPAQNNKEEELVQKLPEDLQKMAFKDGWENMMDILRIGMELARKGRKYAMELI